MKESCVTGCTLSLEKSKHVYSFQFGFRQKHSATHVLIHLTEKFRKQLVGGNNGWAIFVDFQKAFDAIDHNVFFKKLGHYGIRRISNKCFASYLGKITQFVSINGLNSNLTDSKCGVYQGSILDSLLFLWLVFINGLYCKVHRLADELPNFCQHNS